MRKTKPVRECMRRLPVEADRRDPLESVVAHMREHRCHHVPIMDGPRLYGILSTEDLRRLAFEQGGAKPGLRAEDVCTLDPLAVSPMTPVVEVAREMLARHVSSALVEDGDVLVGIFTTTDALRLVAEG